MELKMAERTLAEKIADLDAAIAAIEAGAQSITTADGRTYTRANIRDLYERADRLEAKAARAASAGRTRAEFT